METIQIKEASKMALRAWQNPEITTIELTATEGGDFTNFTETDYGKTPSGEQIPLGIS